MISDQYLKELENQFKATIDRLREELRAVRGSRPSVDLVENIKVSYYDQELPIKQVGSISVVPPRSIQVGVWDKNAVGPVVKAIEGAKLGLSVSNDGQNIVATLSPLVAERREELSRLVKKNAENARIQIRARRDEAIKKIKNAEATEDEVFKMKERIQKAVGEANGQIEELVEGKLKELAE